MATIPHTTVTRAAVWRAFRRTPDARCVNGTTAFCCCSMAEAVPRSPNGCIGRRTLFRGGCTPLTREGSRGWNAK
jgi:hypothetical protein